VLAYWTGTYCFDMLQYLAVTAAVLAVFAAYGEAAFVGTFENFAGTSMLFVAYGASVIPLSYCYAFAFTSPASAQVSNPTHQLQRSVLINAEIACMNHVQHCITCITLQTLRYKHYLHVLHTCITLHTLHAFHHIHFWLLFCHFGAKNIGSV
jgi:hypothetical protein